MPVIAQQAHIPLESVVNHWNDMPVLDTSGASLMQITTYHWYVDAPPAVT